MKVLFAQTYANALSESYMRTELEWAHKAGVDAFVWGEREHPSTYPIGIPHEIGKPLADAVDKFKPDLIHVHWMTLAKKLLPALEAFSIPVTVRAHSFDFSLENIDALVRSDVIKKLFLFPQLCLLAPPSAKIEPMTSCYNPSIYYPGKDHLPRRAFRAGAGLYGKGVDGFLRIASKSPNFEFILALTRATGSMEFVDKVRSDLPVNVSVMVNLSHEQVSDLMRSSRFYLRGIDPSGHPYGMPMSIAEALSCGCIVLTNKNNSPLSNSCLLYETEDEAASIINDSSGWTNEKAIQLRNLSIANASKFTADAVLPRLLSIWTHLISGCNQS